jgi:hypothetical protein
VQWPSRFFSSFPLFFPAHTQGKKKGKKEKKEKGFCGMVPPAAVDYGTLLQGKRVYRIDRFFREPTTVDFGHQEYRQRDSRRLQATGRRRMAQTRSSRNECGTED